MDYLISILRFYFFHSFYDLNEENYTKRDQLDIWNFKLDTPIHNKIRSRCSQKFFSLLRSMNKKYEKEDLVYKIYLFQEEIEKENIGYPSRDLEENLQTSDIDIKILKRNFSDSISSITNEITTTKDNLKNNNDKDKKKELRLRIKKLTAYRSLMIHNNFIIFIEPGKAGENIEDLMEVYKKLFIDSSQNKDESHPMDVITEICISLLFQSSSTIREVVLTCYESLCDQMTKESLEIILKAIDSEENIILEDSDEDIKTEDKMDEENGNDEKEKEDNKEEEEDIEDNERDSEKINESEKESENGTNKNGTDENENGKDNEDENESSLEDMDDEQMFKMDEKVAAVLSSMKTKKKKQKTKI